MTLCNKAIKRRKIEYENRRDKQMNRNIVLELFLIVSVVLFLIPGALALPRYMEAYNTTFNTTASCGVCHVNSTGGGTLNSYGMLFENQSNHSTFPGAALLAIGPAPGTTPGVTTTATFMVTATSNATLIATPLPFNATPAPTETPVLIATPVPVETTAIIETPLPTPTPTPRTPGFEQGVLIAGLLACYFMLKRRNNN
jgi:hypothetical protein